MQWHGKRVVIVGLARQGIALARYLAEQGAKVTASDAQAADKLAEAMAALRDLPIEYVLGGHPPTVLEGADLLCLSGGVPANVPLAQEARRRGVALSNDSQIFLDAAPCAVIGVTGSAGKTTTTALTGRMLAAAGRKVWVGGNIGNPLIADLRQMRADDLAVMELSSFQLEIMTTSPRIAAVLNITPNHLDRHGTMDVYIRAKSHIVRHQRAGDTAVLGLDDENARSLQRLAPGRVWWFSAAAEVPAGAFLRHAGLFLRGGEREQAICSVSDIPLRGAHNVLNTLAACALAGAAGAPPAAMREAIKNFTGVAHRLELVREWQGVKWYNDSIATAPERVIAAIRSFEEPLIVLAGGRDKKLPWGEFAAVARQRVKALVVFGEAAELIARAAEAENEKVEGRTYKAPPKLLRVVRCGPMAEAVQKAAELATAGDAVLLSPGGASFDEFKDFAERGDKFKELVNQL